MNLERRIDDLGRIVIPIEIRRNLKLDKNDSVFLTVEDNKIIISKQDNKEVKLLYLLLGNILKYSFNNSFIIFLYNDIVYSNIINENRVNEYKRDILNKGIVVGNITIYGDNVSEKDILIINKNIDIINEYLN